MSAVTNTRRPDCGSVLYINPTNFGWEKIECSSCDFEDRQPS